MRNGTPLERIRAEQMKGIVGEGEMKSFVPEIAQLAVTEITVHSAKSFEFEFMDGSRVMATV